MAKTGKRAIVSWAFYDWANSAFATTVMAGFFPIFFKQYWSAGVDPVVSTARLGIGNSIAGLVIALTAPVIGAIADKGSARKRFLLFFAFTGALVTSSLSLVPKGLWGASLSVYVLASMCFAAANIFYDSLLPAVSPVESMELVSSLGFGLGYLGGGLLFALNVWATLKPETFGLAKASEAVQLSFLSVGVWWLVFTIPLVIFVHERRTGVSGPGMVVSGLRRFAGTFREIRHMRVIFLFLFAYWLYIDGVDTIVRMAVDYGLSLGFDANDLILALLLTQFVGFPSALMFGLIGRKIGAKKGIFICIGVYLFISVWGAFIRDKGDFYLLAMIIGLVQGGIQALSRSFYARIIPEGKEAEYFGFYNMLGKFAVIIGPLLIGIVGLTLRHMGVERSLASRLGITSIALLFLAGGILFFFTDEDKGRREAAFLEH